MLLQLILAQAAYQAQLVDVAVKAYARVIKLAPDSAEALQARQQVQLLEAPGPKPSGFPLVRLLRTWRGL